MRVSRNFSLAVQFILDELVPPIIRDSRWFMALPMRMVLGRHYRDFMQFKDTVFAISSKQYGTLYEETAEVQELQGETDLNQPCIDAILGLIAPGSVLEVGCGRGFLAGKIAGQHGAITACDIALAPGLAERYPAVQFQTANIEALPFADQAFDTVVCTHTLEHVQNLPAACAELRRVVRRRLIIVVPRQRPYKYTFSLHTQFFPYRWSLEAAFGAGKGVTIQRLGDWLYVDDIRV